LQRNGGRRRNDCAIERSSAGAEQIDLLGGHSLGPRPLRNNGSARAGVGS
jgi:hypothetical protein